MTKIITTAEIKAILGISGTSEDALLEIWNESATDLLTNLLGVTSLTTHTITNERVQMADRGKLVLSEFPVQLSQTITVKDSLKNTISGLYFSQDPGNKRTVNIEDSSGYPIEIYADEALVSYTAGYTTQGTIVALSTTDLAEKTITATVAGVSTTYTFKASGATGNQINVGATVNDLATNIATKLGGTASTATVTLPLGTNVDLGTATTAQLTITDATIPAMLKMAVALIAGGGLAEKNKKGGIASYTIGGKSVSFRSDSEAQTVSAIVTKYAAYFKKFSLNAI